MSRPRLLVLLALMCLSFVGAEVALAEKIRVAVASNFADALREIAHRYEAKSGHKVVVIVGSTGKHYAQITHGAPFDIFFAADRRRPELLQEKGIALPGIRFTYAVGRLVLWSPREDYVDSDGKIIERSDYRYLSVANPKLAPYGVAAKEVLESRGVWKKMTGRMVRGENIGQAFQFVKSGNAELGFVAYSQVKRPGEPIKGSLWEVPQDLYTPIEQQAVILKDRDVVHDFIKFTSSSEIRELLKGYGYGGQ